MSEPGSDPPASQTGAAPASVPPPPAGPSGLTAVDLRPITLPILISAIANLVGGYLWLILSSCFAVFLTAPMLVLCAFEFIFFARAPQMSARDLDRDLGFQPIAVRHRRCLSACLVGRERPRYVGRENPPRRLRVLGKLFKRHLWKSKVSGEDITRGMGKPIGDKERLVFREVPVIEDEKKLAALIQTLDRMRNAGGEVPDG